MKEKEPPVPQEEDFDNAGDYVLAYMDYMCEMFPELAGSYIDVTIRNNIKEKEEKLKK